MSFVNSAQPTPSAGALRSARGEPYTDVTGNGTWDDDMGAAGLGGPGEIVVYRMTYDWPIMIPMFEPFFGDHVMLQANIAVRNEPFE